MRKRKQGWSLLVMRGPGDSVRQIRVSRRSVVAAPAAMALALGCGIGGLQLRAALKIQELETALADQAATYRTAGEAQSLRYERTRAALARMEDEEASLQQRLQDLQTLEGKVEALNRTYRELVPLASSSPLPRAHELALLAEEGGEKLSNLASLVDTMEAAMAESLRAAKHRAALLESRPSVWPTDSPRITSTFGYRSDPFTGRSTFHAGIDIGGRHGDPVYAAADGTVLETGYDTGKGSFIIIGHSGQLKTSYLHLSGIGVQKGASVSRGDRIGALGSTGRSTGAHLHFQIEANGEPVNPLDYVRRERLS
ncbi:peptidoglycan DD-metalloendopeptidase family protein [Paenibacillus sp. IB182496]|uniref:Peptidoglycan DD-metalloendopeptidase family protein n=1 Tax=Paenibacillus sabuli TaxID=2772509 RepID=A0A927GSU8_9BACL|nr:M23 family metallopeptidase [Paenibacillus sabuli]MBD2847139.1 peptidoglycan DD-metalloendopeptidase family protein [Paenibacillus sabuli]